MKLAGIILIALGILALVYQGFSYNETQKDLQLGPVVVQHTETHNVPVPPIIGAICIVTGVVVLVVGGRSNL